MDNFLPHQNQKISRYKAIDLLGYFQAIEKQIKRFEVKTGFNELDKYLSGGLHEGLYVLGAISSLGKTTFALQLADQIAIRHQDVIFFSLETSRYELMAKSISRYTYELNRLARTEDGKNLLAKDLQQILDSQRYTSYSSHEKQTITDAITEYKKIASHIFICDGGDSYKRISANSIREIVEEHIQVTGQKPVVFVDYLQILAPVDIHITDKQSIDINIFEFKKMSRDFGIPIFVVSSFNRNNYDEPVSMNSFKESGAIEYSSDVLFGLQYFGMDYEKNELPIERSRRLRELLRANIEKKCNKTPIQIELKCLKNRNGCQFALPFQVMPAYSHFELKNIYDDTNLYGSNYKIQKF